VGSKKQQYRLLKPVSDLSAAAHSLLSSCWQLANRLLLANAHLHMSSGQFWMLFSVLPLWSARQYNSRRCSRHGSTVLGFVLFLHLSVGSTFCCCKLLIMKPSKCYMCVYVLWCSMCCAQGVQLWRGPRPHRASYLLTIHCFGMMSFCVSWEKSLHMWA
jgi:hypothetical protein